jgi:ACS family hexuronate transporter-like MFS transporter
MSQDKTGQKPTNRRWVVVGLLIMAIIINYTHRQTLSVLKETLSKDLGWDENGYAQVVGFFQLAYAFAYLAWGAILDKIGARIGYTVAFTMWTVAHTLTGCVTTALQFIVARVALGVGESGAFPSSVKAITEWFPQKERALATGIFNAGSSFGALIAPFAVPLIAVSMLNIPLGGNNVAHLPGLNLGWRYAFYLIGGISLLWAVLWFAVYRRPREDTKANAAEIALIEADPADPVEKVGWLKLLTVKETWLFAIAKFLIDPIWWLWLFWLPDFLHKNYGLDITSFGLPIVVVYLLSDVGSVAGGWLSSTLIKSGLSVNVARKTTLFVAALCVLPIFFAQGISDLWTAVLIVGLATAAHQAFSANVYTLPSDLFPRSAVGSVIGIGGFLGGIGGYFMATFVGWILESYKEAHNEAGGYAVIFAIASFTYLFAFAWIHFMSPHLKPAVVTLDFKDRKA